MSPSSWGVFFPIHKAECQRRLRCVRFGDVSWLRSRHKAATRESVQQGGAASSAPSAGQGCVQRFALRSHWKYLVLEEQGRAATTSLPCWSPCRLDVTLGDFRAAVKCVFSSEGTGSEHVLLSAASRQGESLQRSLGGSSAAFPQRTHCPTVWCPSRGPAGEELAPCPQLNPCVRISWSPQNRSRAVVWASPDKWQPWLKRWPVRRAGGARRWDSLVLGQTVYSVQWKNQEGK